MQRKSRLVSVASRSSQWLPLGLCLSLSVGCLASGTQSESDAPVPPDAGEEEDRRAEPADPPEAPAPSVRDDPLSTGLTMEELPVQGSGNFVWASGRSERVGTGKHRKYSVGVEEGLDIDPEAVAALVDSTYADPRSWIAEPRQGFQRVEEGGIKIVIATPKTVDRLCLPLKTRGEVSCAKNGYIPINLKRWEFGVDHWDSSLENYRRYVVNHEMGHYLTELHVDCPSGGGPAPVMMQQTYRLAPCTGNPWPFPEVLPKPGAPP